MILHYLKTSWREGLKYKISTAINVITLTIAFAAFALSGYWHYWEHHFDTFHPEWENTYAITTTGLFKTAMGQDEEINQLHMKDAEIFASLPQVQKITKVRTTWAWPEIKNTKQKIYGYMVDSLFFDIFQAKFIAGNVFKLPYTGEFIVLTGNTAKRLFGTTECTGEVIKLDDGNEVKVAAIMEDYPDNTELLFDYLLLSPSENIINIRSRSQYYVTVTNKQDAVILKKSIEQHKSVAGTPQDYQSQRLSFNLRSLPELHFTCNPSLDERFKNIYILFLTGILLMICALMNNLVLFIGQQEHKLRKNITYLSLGETRPLIFLRYFVALFAPIIIAYILSFGLIEIIFPVFDSFTTLSHQGVLADYTNRMQLNHVLVDSTKNTAFLLAAYLIIAIIPIAYFVHSTKTKATYPVIGLRRILITVQIFIGSVFLITSLCLYKQLNFLKNSPKGIHIENVLQLYLGELAPYQIDSDLLKAKLLQQSSVTDITMTADPVLIPDALFNYLGILEVEGRDIEKIMKESEFDNYMIVEKNFASFFGLQIIEGRFMDDPDKEKYAINETAFRSIGIDDVLQRPVNNSGQVVGIVNDYHYSPMRYPIRPVVYRFVREEEKQNEPYKYVYIKLDGDSQSKTLNSIQSVINEFNNGELANDSQLMWLEDIQKSFNKPEETIFYLFSIFALLCILISSFGIYSLVALSAEQRKREIAIRKVNGALFKDILNIFLKEYLILVIIGNAIALPLGYVFIHRWLETYTYRTTISAGLFVFVFLMTVLIVIIAVWRQVRIAVKVNPAETIKTE